MILHHEFIRIAKKYSKRLAIVDRTLGREVTFGKALIGSLILGKKFSTIDEGFIGVMIPTSAGAILTTLGVVMAGKVPVMINYSTGAAENCEYAQKKCGFHTIITSRALLDKISCRIVKGMIFIEDIMKDITTWDKIVTALKSKCPSRFIINSLPQVDEDDNVVILFTSGSEKEPKAVQLTHRNLGSNMQALIEVFDFTTDDILFSILPLFHVFGYNANFWLPLLVGVKAVTYANPLDYKKIPSIIREEKATIIAGTPIFFAGYLRESKSGDFETQSRSSP